VAEYPYKKVHFVGIAGVGMSALAQILAARGVKVSGSDPQENEATERLARAGAAIYHEQQGGNIAREQPDLVVFTAAAKSDNPEISEARQRGIPAVTRADFLGKLMAELAGPRIAVTGTHGKTTTTSMIASVLIEGDLDPTVLVGGEYAAIGGNVRVGGEAIVTEACEAYDSFLSLKPDIAVVTNVEPDHLDYYGTAERVHQSFREFLRSVPEAGLIVWCTDDEGSRKVVAESEASAPMLTYGFEPTASNSLAAVGLEVSDRGYDFRLKRFASGAETILGSVQLSVPGKHNVLNALAAAAVGLHLGIPFEIIARALHGFRGAGRRFEVRGERDGITVVDDYAHHPTEVAVTIQAARESYPGRRLIAVFQPHLYSRTRDFLTEFANALNRADAILIADIYAAREKPIPGVRSADLARAVAGRSGDKSVMYLPSFAAILDTLNWICQPGDVVLTMGAGDINEVAESFLGAARQAA
jgi:UDP-N-acetylmuramate--alanine ligase